MQSKWLEDFVALAQTRSFARAAELCHVTHPAFGRRIKALEAWAGAPLVERGISPVRLTAAGDLFLETAQAMLRDLESAREEIRSQTERGGKTVTLATGRTLARTLMADWLVRLNPTLLECRAELRILTRALAQTVLLLERFEADFSLVYHHALLAIRLDARQFMHLTLASDKLVPVVRTNAQGQPVYHLNESATPYLAYSQELALGRLVADHLSKNPHAPDLLHRLECDSADALYEYVLNGVGVAWLPWSMVHADCKSGRLALAGDKRMEVGFDVRLYRPKRRLSPAAERVWQEFANR